jgi:uncharacterized protein (DUF427 family)
MSAKPIRIPGPDHPITIEESTELITVRVAGQLVAQTRHALKLAEASYPPVYYIPKSAVSMELLERTDLTTYCPYKGDCNYFSIPSGGAKSVNAVWTYESPYDAVAAIKDHLAFYTDRVDEITAHPT